MAVAEFNKVTGRKRYQSIVRVEDNEQEHHLLRSILKRQGYTVLRVARGCDSRFIPISLQPIAA